MRLALFSNSIALTAGFYQTVRAVGTMGAASAQSLTKTATFGAGCYWGTEKYFKSDFGTKMFLGSGKVVSGQVGFMGPSTAKANPTYREVCTGETQHVEVYNLKFDGDEKTYEDLVKHFFMFHDPTTLNQQGNDMGTQYASAIFCSDQKQMEIATRVKEELQGYLSQGRVPSYKGSHITTAITPATIFYPAQEDHQAYLDKNPRGYCNHFYRFTHWPSK